MVSQISRGSFKRRDWKFVFQ